MIYLFTDFGANGPYLGQLKTVLHQGLITSPPIIDLMSDAPVHNPKAASYLLHAYSKYLPLGAVVIAVVDPGVGSEQRPCVLIAADGRYYLGAGNGLFGVLQQTAVNFKAFKLDSDLAGISRSFHGRDVFAPAAVKLINRNYGLDDLNELDMAMPILGPADLPEVVYIDHFGNLVTGLRATSIGLEYVLAISGIPIVYSPTFASVELGAPFWYVNSSDLIEVAVNCGRASDYFKAAIGQEITIGC